MVLQLNLLLYAENASNGRTTYVHCKAGRGRSTTIVLCYLVSAGFWIISSSSITKPVDKFESCGSSIKFPFPNLLFDRGLIHFNPYLYFQIQVKYKHMTPADALEHVRSRRPRVLLAPSQWKVWLFLFILYKNVSMLFPLPCSGKYCWKTICHILLNLTWMCLFNWFKNSCRRYLKTVIIC